jgi:hypothetical protein
MWKIFNLSQFEILAFVHHRTFTVLCPIVQDIPVLFLKCPFSSERLHNRISEICPCNSHLHSTQSKASLAIRSGQALSHL